MELQNYSIMPLDVAHLEEICLDIKKQYELGTATCALFMMTLVPEGNPPVDKVSILCEQYKMFKERLDAEGLCSGVLVQASMGHGWVLSELFPYQSYTAISNGEMPHVVCPYDEGFRSYIRRAFSVIASCHPDTIMLDDDFRLMSFRSYGCGCPLHVKKFNEWFGGTYTREKIWELLHAEGEEGDRANRIFTETQRDALIGCARLIREGIDAVAPEIPGTFCCVGNDVECASEIAEIMAGKGHPRVVRINNGHYTAPSNHGFSNVFRRAAESIAKLKDKVDVILAETDTCPQNRYSTSAMSLHTHFVGTILEGANGAKHWITRLNAYEPESGSAYRRVLGKYNGFYQTLSALVPHLRHRGCCIPVTDTPCFDMRGTRGGNQGWSVCVLERLGLPMFFGSKPSGVVCLDGIGDSVYSDDELDEMFSGAVFLASDTAARLIQRGYGKELGVTVRPWEGAYPTVERFSYRNNVCPAQYQIREIVPTSQDTKEVSTVLHTVDYVNFERLFPGVTSYRNSRGGVSFVFSGTPNAPYTLTDAFSFLNQSRKQQLMDLMRSVGELPLCYLGDEEVYFRAADVDDGRRFCAVFNLGYDPIEKIVLESDCKVSSIEILEPNGSWKPVTFEYQDGVITVAYPAHTLVPVIMVLS